MVLILVSANSIINNLCYLFIYLLKYTHHVQSDKVRAGQQGTNVHW